MIERKDGVIIISSIGGFRGNSIIGTYAMTKAADMALQEICSRIWTT